MSSINKNMLADFNLFDAQDFLRKLNNSTFSNKAPCITTTDGLNVIISSNTPLNSTELIELTTLSNNLISTQPTTRSTLSFSSSDISVNTTAYKNLSCATLRRKNFKKIESVVIVTDGAQMADMCTLELRCNGFEVSNALIGSLSIPITTETTVYKLNLDESQYPDHKKGDKKDDFILQLRGACNSGASCNCKVFRMNIYYENEDD